MAIKNSFVAEPGKPTVVTTRTFDAPRALVFEAVTRPEHIAEWYGPRGYVNPICHADLRPGGAYRVINRAPDGTDHGFKGVYKEIDAPSKLVRTWIYEPWPDTEAVETLTFEEEGGKTTLTWVTTFPTVAERDAFVKSGAEKGGAETMERLAERLAKIKPSPSPAFELVLDRFFEAPRELVFEAWSKPEHMKRWFAPKGFELSTCEVDFRAGGQIKICMKGFGQEHWSVGKYDAVVPPEKIAWSGDFEGGTGPDQVRTVVTFAAEGKKTRVHVVQSMMALNAVTEPAANGAPIGWGMTLDQLGTFVAELQKAGRNTPAERRV